MLSNRISKDIYGRSNFYYHRRYDLVSPDNVAQFPPIEYHSKELIVGITKPARYGYASDAIVLGGPCIDHCAGDWNLLTFQAIADCWIALVAARDLRLPCVITIEDWEQALVSGLPYATWRGIAERLARIVRGIAFDLGISDQVRIVFTGDGFLSSLLDEMVVLLGSHLSEDCLGGIFNINEQKGRRVEEVALLASYQRNAVLHLPTVAAKILERSKVPLVIVAENLQQVKANRIVRQMNVAAGLPGDVMHVVFSVTPSLGGRTRMSRANDSEKLYLVDDIRNLTNKICSGSENSREYWGRMIPGRSAASLHDNEAEGIAYSLRRVALKGDRMSSSPAAR